MASFARWMMLLVSMYAVYLLAKLYVTRPDALVNTSGTGLTRLAFTGFLCVAIFLLARSILQDWRRDGDSKKGRRSLASKSGEEGDRREHPLLVAFKGHPFLASVYVLAIVCTPFLLQVVSRPERPMFDRANLCWLAAGLVLLAIGIVILHLKSRRKGNPRSAPDHPSAKRK